jgi:hypothetical protein
MNPESILVRLQTQKHVKNELSIKNMFHFMHEFYSAQILQDPFHGEPIFTVGAIFQFGGKNH